MAGCDGAASVAFLSHDVESPTLLKEAKNCFKRGLDIAAVLTATAYIEMTLADELKDAGRSQRKPKLEKSLKGASKNPSNLPSLT
ncbi:hypothetical protein ACFQS6_23510 [Xanthomonas populi]